MGRYQHILIIMMNRFKLCDFFMHCCDGKKTMPSKTHIAINCQIREWGNICLRTTSTQTKYPVYAEQNYLD